MLRVNLANRDVPSVMGAFVLGSLAHIRKRNTGEAAPTEGRLNEDKVTIQSEGAHRFRGRHCELAGHGDDVLSGHG
jgi:hypothetical protein